MEGKELLEYLQSKFVCKQCGTCCAIGGDMTLTTHEVGRIMDFVVPECYITKPDMFDPVPHKKGLWKFKTNAPCPMLDRTSMLCLCHDVKPSACKKFPFMFFAEGGCDFITLFNCPGARRTLSEYFGFKR
jgi:Fe-S-cluster containining protein